MAASTNIHGFNIGGNNNSFEQRGHFYRAFLDGNVSGMLVKQNSTPNMTVLVEHGSALLDKNTISASVAEIKSDTSVTIDTANTSNPRIDTVVIYEDTSVAIPTVEANYWQDGDGGRFKIVSLPGTAGAVPVALSDANIQTAIGAGKPWTRLADITVPANSTTIVNSNINNSARSKLATKITHSPVYSHLTTNLVQSMGAGGNFAISNTANFAQLSITPAVNSNIFVMAGTNWQRDTANTGLSIFIELKQGATVVWIGNVIAAQQTIAAWPIQGSLSTYAATTSGTVTLTAGTTYTLNMWGNIQIGTGGSATFFASGATVSNNYIGYYLEAA